MKASATFWWVLISVGLPHIPQVTVVLAWAMPVKINRPQVNPIAFLSSFFVIFIRDSFYGLMINYSKFTVFFFLLLDNKKINLFLFPYQFIMSPEFNQSSDCSLLFLELTTGPPPKKLSTC